jgi:hypothetical protein
MMDRYGTRLASLHWLAIRFESQAFLAIGEEVQTIGFG